MNATSQTIEANPNATAVVDAPAKNKSASGVTDMITDLSNALESAIEEIHSVNAETKVLALNARIEAARAGSYGAAFSVVAEEMQQLSDKTSQIANDMASRTRDKTVELMDTIGTTIRGTRLCDIALASIDLVDRNLYERTCDVRWWATDGSVVDALSDQTEAGFDYASKRLGVILKAYTVYYDLLLCDRDGKVVANGRPDLYATKGRDLSNDPWFRSAMNCRTGDEYGFQTAHRSSLVGNEASLVYSCPVRNENAGAGDHLGALGIVFNWAGLYQPILDSLPISAEEKTRTSAYFIDHTGLIVASNRSHNNGERLNLERIEEVFANDKGFFNLENGGEQKCVAYAKAPGFETYSTNWHAVVVQDVE